MSTKILFGNNVGYKINNYLTKKSIIDYLQKNIDSFSLRTNLIINKDNLVEINNNEYNLIPNLEGTDYIFLIVKLNKFYCLCLIEKKTLNNFNNINYNNLNIIHVKIRVSEMAYNGTIFDGRVVNLGVRMTFIINKVYKLNGKSMIDFNINQVVNQTKNFIDKCCVTDNNMNTIILKLNKIYKLNELVSNVSNDTKYDSIDFVSKNLSKTYRYYFNNNDYLNLTCNIYGKLIGIDVIELFANNKDNQMKRIDIAHIPDIKTSRLCNTYILKDSLSLLKCRFKKSFKKWIPEELLDDSSNADSYEDVKLKML